MAHYGVSHASVVFPSVHTLVIGNKLLVWQSLARCHSIAWERQGPVHVQDNSHVALMLLQAPGLKWDEVERQPGHCGLWVSLFGCVCCLSTVRAVAFLGGKASRNKHGRADAWEEPWLTSVGYAY